MSKLKKMMNSSPVHSRTIDLRTYAVGEKHVIVEGKLKDDRHCAVYDLTGDKLEEGTIHHLALRILIDCDSMKVEELESDMIHVPHKECLRATESINAISGMEIKGGFAKNVMEKLGGVKGCAHLTRLLIAMSQEVFQGISVKQRKRKRPAPKTLEEIPGLQYLLNSCKMWEEEGFKIQRLRNALIKTKVESAKSATSQEICGTV